MCYELDFIVLWLSMDGVYRYHLQQFSIVVDSRTGVKDFIVEFRKKSSMAMLTTCQFGTTTMRHADSALGKKFWCFGSISMLAQTSSVSLTGIAQP
jgi:hypothetical protein